MKRVLVFSVGAILSLIVGGRAEAGTIYLTPADTGCTTGTNSNLNAAGVLAIIDDPAPCFSATGPLTLLYKANVDGTPDSGTFASAYDTIFSNTAAEPQDAWIKYLGGVSMGCSACYLVVKDGNQQIAQYFFDISSWNGTDDIKLKGFWPGNGAISNVAIWGRATVVPEPGSLMLFGTAIGLLSLKRRRVVA